ncbi:cation diffusion facilitator family transporter [Baekduia sp. Peel2402]|uniref:cation diffusion facilitator family transporter n=1 Tax=Baekduia sp. Peel2402 TaxID=3458296 RepID=UPI00403ECFFB
MGHGHDHSHDGHGGHGHSHEISADADRGKLAVALALILGFMAVEVAVGIAASSLALLSDAAHMLTDAAAIALALVAINLAKRPAKGAFTFGLRRAEILSAQFNGATLLVLGLLVVVEGIRRVINPPDVEGTAVLIVALVGVVVNLIATMVLARANRDSLNVEGAYQHLLTDLAAFIATAIAGAIILLTDFREADGIAALIVAAIMLYASYGLLKESGRIFLEAAPRGMDPDEIGQALAHAPGVVEVHDLHVWEVSSGFPSLAAHVVVGRDCDCHQARMGLQTLLRDRFGIEHTTLQMDHECAELLQIEPVPAVSVQAASAAGPPAGRPR